MKAAPGVLQGIMFRLFVRLAPVEGASIERLVEDGQQLPGNLAAIH